MKFRKTNIKVKSGWIELITGCMFAGKTEEFIRRIKRHKYSGNNVLVFKPEIDIRYSKKDILTHSGIQLDAITIKNAQAIKEYLDKYEDEVHVIGIDEVQFLDEEIVNLLEDYSNKGIICIVNGLDKDFKADPFKNVDKLLVMAEHVDKLSAICLKCGSDANWTQRIIDNKMVSADAEIISVAGADKYEARCRHCYVKPK